MKDPHEIVKRQLEVLGLQIQLMPGTDISSQNNTKKTKPSRDISLDKAEARQASVGVTRTFFVQAD